MSRGPGRPPVPWAEERLAAKAAGQTRYQPPGPCLRGHVAKRFVSNNGCCACFNETRGKQYTGNRIVDAKTPDRLQWLADRAAARAKYRRTHRINQIGETQHAR
jgi:hypothetical protein